MRFSVNPSLLYSFIGIAANIREGQHRQRIDRRGARDLPNENGSGQHYHHNSGQGPAQ
jgi:hypothetical protein